MRGTRAIIFIGAALVTLAYAPSAQAVFDVSTQVDFATDPIAVGGSGTGSLSLTNDSTAGEDADIERAVLEPSCRNPGETPPCTDREPGIFSIGNGTGAIGTACQGVTFTSAPAQAPFGGAIQFTPGAPVNVLMNATCVINFSYTALAVPTVDTQGPAGTQTDQLSLVRAELNGGGPISFGPGTGDTTVNPAPPVTPPVLTPTPLVTTPVVTPRKCKKGQKLKKGKCVKKKAKRKK